MQRAGDSNGGGGQDAADRPVLGLVFAIGVFALAAQTWLFRTFFSVFEGSEFSIAIFFSSWTFWVMAGAWLARVALAGDPGAGARARVWVGPGAVWLYVPACLLQYGLTLRARALAGIDPHTLFPLFQLAPVAFLVNAPVSLCSGYLFTAACTWVRGTQAVARVYLVEAAGSCAGGLLCTLLLAAGVPGPAVWLAAAGAIGVGWLAAAPAGSGRRAQWRRAWPLCLVLLALAGGLDRRWQAAANRHAWSRLLPAAGYAGSFTTAQETYHYGVIRGQFSVVAAESVVDSFPDRESAAETAAVLMAQHPGARRILVIGPGTLALSAVLAGLPAVEYVAWSHPDPAYPARVRAVLPAPWRAGLARVQAVPHDVRAWLQGPGAGYDLVAIAPGPASTLATTRYCTREFLALAGGRLRPGGVLAVGVQAGENFMGDERVNMGASVYAALRARFPRLAIKPGDTAWLMASPDAALSEQPAVLRDRFAARPGGAACYPPDGLLSLYLPDRSERLRARYEAALAADRHGLLRNSERQPRALLHALLFATREAGARGGAAAVRRVAAAGHWLVPGALLLYVLLRSAYAGRTAAAPAPSRHDSGYLVFATGAAGMGTVTVLMYMYQLQVGSLFLHAGLLSAVFMAGLVAGGALVRRLGRGDPAPRLLAAGLAAHVLFLLALARMPARLDLASALGWFLAAGALGGIYVPLAAGRLAAAGMGAGPAGARVEVCDHLGALVGGVCVGLLLLPLFGLEHALHSLALLVASGFVLYARRPAGWGSAPAAGGWRATGYVAFGAALYLLAAAGWLRQAGPGPAADLERQARTLAGANGTVTAQRCALAGGGSMTYYRADATNTTVAYVFPTAPLAGAIRGYAGPIELAAAVTPAGELCAVSILRSGETPVYLARIRAWMDGLRGRNVFTGGPAWALDGVTGATISARAVRDTLRMAGPAFARQALGRAAAGGDAGAAAAGGATASCDARLILLGAGIAVALALRRRPSRPWRCAFLVALVATAGLWLNMQYAPPQVLALFVPQTFAAGWRPWQIWWVLVPVMVLFLGNLYCGWLCPFGALQELVAALLPARWRVRQPAALSVRLRRVRYGLLWLAAVLFAIRPDAGATAHDPLVSAFDRGHVAGAAVLCLVVALCVDRFWCLYLCPAGAFLSLLNRLRWLRLPQPRLVPARCPYGTGGERDGDCLACDRCRQPGPDPVAPKVMPRRLALLLGLAVTGFAIHYGVPMWRAAAGSLFRRNGVGVAVQPVGGQARRMDLQRIRQRIRAGELSGQEARYYRPIPAGAATSGDGDGYVHGDAAGLDKVDASAKHAGNTEEN